MSLTSDALRKLASLSLSPEQMSGVLEILADLESAEEHRKAGQRERVRRHRERSRYGNVTETFRQRDQSVTAPSLEEKREVSPCTPSREKTQLSPDLAPLGDTTGATDLVTAEQGKTVKPPTPRSPTAPAEHPDFAEFWGVYPRRLGTNSRAGAAVRFGALAKSGVDPGALIAGAQRYARQCAALGRVGTEFVQQATTWLNPKTRAWEEAYELPDQPQQPRRRDGGSQQAGTGNPLLAACRDRMSRLGDGERFADPAPGASGRDPFGDPPPHGFDRGEPVRGDHRGGDRRRGGDAFDDAASWR